MLILNIIILTGLERVRKIKCYVVSVLLQYCVLSSFLWILLEGVLLYQMDIMVFKSTRIRLPFIYAIAYGIPLVIITVSSSVRPDKMITEKYCWPSHENGTIWSVVGPIALVIMVNILLFAMAMNYTIRIGRMNAANERIQERKENLIKRLKSMMSLTCLLGFTWIVGFFYEPQKSLVAACLFITLNGLQGVFMFVTQIILNHHTRQKLFVIYKEKLSRFTSGSSFWNLFSTSAKPPPDPKEDAEGKTIVVSDVCPAQELPVNPDVLPTAPPCYNATTSSLQELRSPLFLLTDPPCYSSSTSSLRELRNSAILPTAPPCYNNTTTSSLQELRSPLFLLTTQPCYCISSSSVKELQNSVVLPSTPPCHSNTNTSSLEEGLDNRHPFEINYDK